MKIGRLRDVQPVVISYILGSSMWIIYMILKEVWASFINKLRSTKIKSVHVFFFKHKQLVDVNLL